MQRAKRRLTCSRASASSATNGRTSSAGGDCVAISRNSNRFIDVSHDDKAKLRGTNRYNGRRTSSNLKRGKKSFGVVKSQRRPTYGSLQNAVVLAPFYTLKRSFQTKLVDLYSHEKLKKLNNQIKMAKRQNVSFEYDVLEVKPPAKGNGKRGEPAPQKKKTPPARRKRKQSKKPQIYCDCDDEQTTSKGGSKTIAKIGQQNLKTKKRKTRNPSSIPETSSPGLHMPLEIYENQVNKRRRLDNQVLTAPLLKSGLVLKYSKSNGNLQENVSNTISNLSSKGDSWETFSDSLSFREERLEGSLAISTTSFDSCLEQSSYDGVDPIPVTAQQSLYTRMKMIEALRATNPEKFAALSLKSKTDESRHLIMNDQTKNSDNRINDFMDREPQTQGITCTDLPQNLQPLPRRSRTRTKKPSPETPTSCNYYLRSLREEVETKGIGPGQNLNFSIAESHPHKPTASTSRGFMEEEIMRRRLSQNRTSPPETGRTSNLDVAATPSTQNKQDKQTHFLFQSQSKTVEESYSQTDEMFSPLNTTRSKSSAITQIVIQDTNTNEQALQTQNNRKPNAVTSERDNQPNERKPEDDEKVETCQKTTTTTTTTAGPEFRFSEETGTTIMPTTTVSTATAMTKSDLVPVIEEAVRYHGPSSVERTSARLRDAREEKESSFIFGPRSNTGRLGESCEFSFGLNWILSDEEDSDHGGDRFF